MPSFNTASQLSANVLDTVAPLLVTATDKSLLEPYYNAYLVRVEEIKARKEN